MKANPRVPLLAVLLSCCGNPKVNHPDSDAGASPGAGGEFADASQSEGSAGGGDGGSKEPVVQPPEASLCDGSGSLRLAHYSEPVNASSGQVVLLERGAQNLYVDGSCRAWVRGNEWDALRVLDLTDDSAQELSRNLRLPEWQALDESYCVDVVDLGPLGFYFDSKLIVLSGCNTLPAAPFDIWASMRSEIVRLYAMGAPVEGVV